MKPSVNKLSQLATKYLRIFLRHGGGEGDVKPFSALPQSTLDALKARFLIEEEEVVILAAAGEIFWLLFTAERIIWTSSTSSATVPLYEISDATIDGAALSQARSKKNLRNLILKL